MKPEILSGSVDCAPFTATFGLESRNVKVKFSELVGLLGQGGFKINEKGYPTCLSSTNFL